MSDPFIDTDIIVRFATGDDPAKRDAALNLFGRVSRGDLTLQAPVTVIADTVHVLSSPRLYDLPRDEIAAMLIPLVRLPGFHVADRHIVLRALELYGMRSSLDFGDAMLVASMEAADVAALYSYDRHFDRFDGVTRLEPPPVGSNGA